MKNNTMKKSKGSCYCGQVQFTVTGKLREVLFCHCSQCRKLSGHIVAASAATKENIDISGQVSWYQSSPNHRRGFCGNCGSPLFWQNMDLPTISIMAGALDNVQLSTKAHIFCADKADYYEINDTLKQYNQGY